MNAEREEILLRNLAAFHAQHAEIMAALDAAGCPTGNEHGVYDAVERIAGLHKTRDYAWRQVDEMREALAGARGGREQAELKIKHAYEDCGGFESQVRRYRTEIDALKAGLDQEKKWKNEDPRMLREQIRVADVAFNHLHGELDALKLKLEVAKVALGFYAGCPALTSHDAASYDSGSFENDRGQRAREALSQLNGGVVCPRCGARSQQEADDRCDGTGCNRSDQPQCASWPGELPDVIHPRRVAREQAEEALREIEMECGHPDPSDGEGTSPQDVVSSVGGLKRRAEQAEARLARMEMDDDEC